ncbi:NADH dehydrogenase [ubiquinone] iron-sulfur protein 1, mitochondrial [Quillaja saponaria]|uniref:NADH dehydrogenase [ubiquinone] iron-sulfur protein 1, mitochondrial n=1 Tax=Quillaja saponaria TaxID=32244 RepID=A0AAD7PMC9_QUISA|nr:NADH dehydrogenase [ubiquinone] iron-sulfur protein 1, mitochondrial [Quillaja saponaria]
MGSNNIWCEGTGMNPNADLRSGYLMNTSIAGLEKADVFLLVGTQPRLEADMHVGTGPQKLLEIAERRHPFYSTLANAKNPVIIVGARLFERQDKGTIFSAVETIAANAKVVRPYWNGLNALILNVA